MTLEKPHNVILMIEKLRFRANTIIQCDFFCIRAIIKCIIIFFQLVAENNKLRGKASQFIVLAYLIFMNPIIREYSCKILFLTTNLIIVKISYLENPMFLDSLFQYRNTKINCINDGYIIF